MINIDLSKLNALEKEIFNILMAHSKIEPDIKINHAAELCNCSVSKISKFVKKLGFTNYKQYMNFVYGREMNVIRSTSELSRIKKVIDDFDHTMVDAFLDLFDSHERIVLFGYGPSLIVAQYFEYRLRVSSNKFIISISDELSVESMVDEKTLLIIFTATGAFKSFESIYNATKKKDGEVLIIVEEYNTALFSHCDRIFALSKFPQPAHLKPHEKSRTVFFIFIEEVIQKMIANKKVSVSLSETLNSSK